MSYDIVNQVGKLFENKEQWDSFLDIANQRNLIRDTWWRKFLSAVNKTTKSVQNWGYSANNAYDYHWYINDFGINSFCLVAANLWGKFSFGLWAPQNKYDIKKLSEFLQKEEFGEPIKAKFDRLDYIGNDTTEWKFAAHFIFDGLGENEEMDIDRMAWFANYKTAEFVSQFIPKIEKFQEDEEITKILLKLNEECLKK
jgi:hypothetical protein